VKLSGYGIELSEISHDKLEKIRAWRNHPEIVAVSLDKQLISESQQGVWFDSLAVRKDCLYLVISYKDEDIGVVSALSATEDDSDVTSPLLFAKVITPGIYIAPDCKYKSSVLAFCPSLVFIDYLFKQGQCLELNAQVFEYNESAIRYNKMLGYQEGLVDKEGLLTMTLNDRDFECAKQTLSKILRF